MTKTKFRAMVDRGGREVQSRLSHGRGERSSAAQRVVEIEVETCGEPRLRARRERIKRIRSEIEAGTYLTEARLSYAIEKMMDRLADESAHPARA